MARQMLAEGAWTTVQTTKILRNGKTRWRARCSVREFGSPRAVQVERTAETKAGAETEMRALILSMATDMRSQIQSSETMEELGQRWGDALGDSGLALQTIQAYRRTLRNSYARYLGRIPVSAVTALTLETVYREVRNDKAQGPGAAKLLHTVVSGVLQFALRHGHVEVNVARSVVVPRKSARKTIESLSETQEKRLREHLAQDPYARLTGLSDLILFMLGTGTRIGEAGALRWDDVDLVAGVVTIRATLISLQDKGGTQIQEYTKTGKVRVLRIGPWLVRLLEHHKRDYRAHPRGVVFTSVQGHLLERSNASKAIKRIFREAGLPESVTSHTLRRTAATKLWQHHRDVTKVSAQLGHSRTSTTFDHYISRQVLDTGAEDVL